MRTTRTFTVFDDTCIEFVSFLRFVFGINSFVPKGKIYYGGCECLEMQKLYFLHDVEKLELNLHSCKKLRFTLKFWLENLICIEFHSREKRLANKFFSSRFQCT